MTQNKRTNEISTKTFFIKYGICSGFLAVLLLIVVYTATLANHAWRNNFRNSIINCLNEKEYGVWALGSFVEIDNPFSTTCVCYEARKKDSDELYYAFMARITSFYGPINCVFICTSDGEVSFVGTSKVHGRIRDQINENLFSTRIKYFSERLPLVLNLNGGKSK